MEFTYTERNITDLLISKIGREQVIVLTGARQTGKSTLSERIIPKKINKPFTYISFDDVDERIRFQHSGIAILESLTTPLVILDEVQKIPPVFEQVKYVVDKQKRTTAGQKNTFILTGSSQLILLKNIKETLAGRVALFNLYPFSLSEIIKPNRSPLLSKVWRGYRLSKKDVESFYLISPEISRYAIRIRNEHQLWGGYPPVWQRDKKEDKINWLKNYRKTYLERDISDVGQVANLDNFSLAQKLLCARTGQLLSMSEVARDLSLAVNTVKRYLNLLTLSFQCYLVPPYFKNISKRLIKSPKIYFPDAGLNRVILGELTTHSGAAYESWVFSELIKWKQLQPIEPEIFFYRTNGGLEVDFLIVGEETMIPIEVKSANRVSAVDGRSLDLFMSENKKRISVGLVVYPGSVLAEIRKNIWAVPDWFLFGGV